MDSENSFLRSFLDEWRRATQDGNHELALICSIAGYLFASRVEPGLASVFLLKMELSTVALQGRAAEEVLRRLRVGTLCSFCEQGPEKVRIIAGGGANICHECARKFHTRFANDEN